MTAMEAMVTAKAAVALMVTVMLVSVMAEGGGLLSKVFFWVRDVSCETFFGCAEDFSRGVVPKLCMNLCWDCWMLVC